MNDKKTLVLTPALIGGAIAGLLSGIPIVSCLCCLWIIGGAILATYLLGKNTPAPLASSDGAIIGMVGQQAIVERIENGFPFLTSQVDGLIQVTIFQTNSQIAAHDGQKIQIFARKATAGCGVG